MTDLAAYSLKDDDLIVAPADVGWVVRRAGTPTGVVALDYTIYTAMAEARALSAREGVDIAILDRDGRVIGFVDRRGTRSTDRPTFPLVLKRHPPQTPLTLLVLNLADRIEWTDPADETFWFRALDQRDAHGRWIYLQEPLEESPRDPSDGDRGSTDPA